MYKKIMILVILPILAVLLACNIPKTNALTLTESTEQQGGGGYVDVIYPFNKYLMVKSNEETNIDSYDTLIYVDSNNVFKVYENGTYNVIGSLNGWNDTQDISQTYTYFENYLTENYDIKLISGSGVTNEIYLQMFSIVDVDIFESIFSEFVLELSSNDNDFIYNGDLTIQVKGKPTLNYDGDNYISLNQTHINLSVNEYNGYADFYIGDYLDYYSQMIDYYGIEYVDFYVEFYLSLDFDLYFSEFDFNVYLVNYAYSSAFPYQPTTEMLTAIYGGDIVEEIINPDFSSWLVEGVGSFMNLEIIPGWSIAVILSVMIGIPLLIYILRLFFGG